jgi:hypothetical protein
MSRPYIIKKKRSSIFIRDSSDQHSSLIGKKLYLNDYFSSEKLKKCYNIFWDSNVIILDIPEWIRNIDYTKNYNISAYLPETLNRLLLVGSYNQSVDNLPPELKILYLGYEFNQPVDNLPTRLYDLHFGTKFNQPVNFLPESLKHVEFSYYFNQDLSNLPKSVQTIKLNCDYKKVNNNTLKNIFVETKIIYK